MNKTKKETQSFRLSQLFPSESLPLLTGGGKEFIERIGENTARQVIHHVMMGGNLREHTEPLTRRRVTQISCALIALFIKGCEQIPSFNEKLSEIALRQLRESKIEKSDKWLAQWLVGLTEKGVQNVLHSNDEAYDDYLTEFELAIKESSSNCLRDIGDLRVNVNLSKNLQSSKVEFRWEEITRIVTAIGSQTLAIRGSDKSIYGKLFERLILGSCLSILGFEMVDPNTNQKNSGVFWLSDGSNNRECDATILYKPGKLARFDIGFIGSGNSEISKDKLSRYESEVKLNTGIHSSVTFIIVDKLPQTSKTMDSAKRIGAEIIQMSMAHWPKLLSQKLGARLGLVHPLQGLPENQIKTFLTEELSKISILDFVPKVSGRQSPASQEKDFLADFLKLLEGNTD